jgi:hypothetical protein
MITVYIGTDTPDMQSVNKARVERIRATLAEMLPDVKVSVYEQVFFNGVQVMAMPECAEHVPLVCSIVNKLWQVPSQLPIPE